MNWTSTALARGSKSKAGRERLQLIADQAVVAANGLVLIFVGARALSANGLSSFSIILLLVTSTVALQRASLLGAGLASQRHAGQGVVPLRWLTVALLAGFVTTTATWSLVQDFRMTVLCGAAGIASSIACAQDTLRYAALSRGSKIAPLFADSLWLLGTASALAVGGIIDAPASASYFLLIWSLFGALSACSLGMLISRMERRVRLPRLRLSGTWLLGRWAFIDVSLGIIANILPTTVTFLAVDSALSGVYRTMQATQGPLNVVSTSLLVSAGLASWRLTDAQALARLRRKTYRLSAIMAGSAAIYLFLGSLVIWQLTNVSLFEHPQVIPVIIASGVMNAMTAPVMAAASALGRQRSGAVVRVATLMLSIAVSGLAATTTLDLDPIGTVSILAAAIGLVGWLAAFTREVGQGVIGDITVDATRET